MSDQNATRVEGGLRLVTDEHIERPTLPLPQAEAEAIMRACDTIRRVMTSLPEESDVRRRWLASADTAAVGAQLRWPGARRPRGHR